MSELLLNNLTKRIERLEKRLNIKDEKVSPKIPPPPPPPPPPKTVEKEKSITMEELNSEMKKVYKILGDRTEIDNVLKRYGVCSLSELSPRTYDKVLCEINELY